ncbi:MAG TPA: hypothetical protein VNQ90_11295 [Chthoniobacteraceae bacterium]|nr:hypothetical protein [Chthoniobacteraceae bacterium]
MKTSRRLVVALFLAVMLLPVGAHAEEAGRKAGPSQGVLSDLESVREQVLYEIRILEAAKDQFALDKKAAPGTAIPWDRLKRYLKPTSRLGLLETPVDLLGHPIELGNIGAAPLLSKQTVAALKVDSGDPVWTRYCAKAE